MTHFCNPDNCRLQCVRVLRWSELREAYVFCRQRTRSVQRLVEIQKEPPPVPTPFSLQWQYGACHAFAKSPVLIHTVANSSKLLRSKAFQIQFTYAIWYCATPHMYVDMCRTRMIQLTPQLLQCMSSVK